jgi:F-type H+-transporting ATPase subunit delta
MKTAKQARREATKLYRMCIVDGVLDQDRVRRVVRRFTAARPRDYVLTLSQFRRLVALDMANHTARVESARRLEPNSQAGLITDLERAYGSGLSATFLENPALIGGMRIQVGSDVYDGSVRSRLAAMEQRF